MLPFNLKRYFVVKNDFLEIRSAIYLLFIRRGDERFSQIYHSRYSSKYVLDQFYVPCLDERNKLDCMNRRVNDTTSLHDTVFKTDYLRV